MPFWSSPVPISSTSLAVGLLSVRRNTNKSFREIVDEAEDDPAQVERLVPLVPPPHRQGLQLILKVVRMAKETREVKRETKEFIEHAAFWLDSVATRITTTPALASSIRAQEHLARFDVQLKRSAELVASISVESCLIHGKWSRDARKDAINKQRTDMHERSINLTSTVLEIPDDVLRSHLRGEAAALESDTEPALLRLPETPPAYGREKIVEDLVAVTVQGNEPICINGPAGMGKTNMALNVLRDVLVQETFGHRRFFVRCAGATSVELLEVAIARCLRIRTSGVHPRTTIRAAIEAELQMSPALLVLDSLESIFRVIVTIQSAQAELQALLYGLTMIPGVSLIVTLRGVIKPAGLEWHQVPLLGPIDVPSARRLFLSIAPGHQQEPDLIDLLEYVDRQPLPIRLLAHQAAMEPSLVYVVGQWEAACGGALIRKGRMEEFPPVLRVSLELAWDSLKLDALSRELGSLIALLPQGADVVDIDTLVDDIDACSSSSSLCCLPWYCAGSCSRGITTAKGRHAAARLVACGLAFLDETHARLRMLAPVREFITCHHPPSRLEFDVLVSRFLFVLQLGGLPLWPAVAIPYAESDSISRLIQKEALNLNFILTKAFQCPANKSQIRVMLLTLKHSRHLAYLASHEFESLIWTATHAAVNAREFKLATDIVLLWAPLLACETVNYQDALSFAQRAKDMCREREARLALADNILDSFGRESEAEFAIDLEPNICKSGNRSRSRSAGQPGSAASPAEGQPQSPRATAAAHEDVSHLFRAEMFLQSLLEQRQPESQHPSFSVTSPIATNQAARAHRSLARFSSLLGRDQDAQIHLMKALQLADRRATLNLTFERSPATVRVLAVDEEEEETEREGEVGKQEGNEGFRASCHIQLGDIFFRRAVFSEDESPHADDAGAHERERESALEHYLLAREICTNLTATGTAPGSTHPHTHAHTSKHANANPIEMKCRAARANFRLASLYLYDAYDGSSQFVGDVATGTPTAGGTATRTAAGTGTGGRASAAILAGLAYLRELDGECCEGHPTAYSHTPPIAQLHPPSGHSSHSGQSQSPASLLSDVLDHFERYVVDLDWLDASLSPSGGRGGGRRAEGRERGRANANPGRSAKAVQGEWERVGLGFFVNALLREAELARLEGVLE